MDAGAAAIARLSVAVERFTVPLRMGEGTDEIALDELKSALVEAARLWRDQDTLPKSLVLYLIDLSSVVEATSHLYYDERGDRVRDIAEELQELVWKVVGAGEASTARRY